MCANSRWTEEIFSRPNLILNVMNMRVIIGIMEIGSVFVQVMDLRDLHALHRHESHASLSPFRQ